MDHDLIAEVRSWIWQDLVDGWVELCVLSRYDRRRVYNGLVVGSDFRVVYSVSYDREDGRQEASCRLRREDGTDIQLTIGNARGSDRRDWRLRRDDEGPHEPQPVLGDVTDLDLSWTPLSNSFAFWRLNLEVGESKEIVVAWVQLPDLKVEVARQRYSRLAERRFRFEGPDGFVADLDVDEFEIVDRYGDIWERQDLMEPRPLLD